jgi:hypothetical protein
VKGLGQACAPEKGGLVCHLSQAEIKSLLRDVEAFQRRPGLLKAIGEG